MIGMLTGTCLMSGTGEAIIDVNGVGYLVQCGSRTLGAFGVGETVCVHVETHVREQAITLFGFATEEERAWFVRLQSVQGVGPKAALAILDILSPAEILSAASLEDKASFARASGVGPKLAGRIAAELSGKPPPAGRGVGPLNTPTHKAMAKPEAADDTSTIQKDAVSALSNLGIDQSSALRAVASALQTFPETPSLDDLIKQALKEMSS